MSNKTIRIICGLIFWIVTLVRTGGGEVFIDPLLDFVLWTAGSIFIAYAIPSNFALSVLTASWAVFVLISFKMGLLPSLVFSGMTAIAMKAILPTNLGEGGAS